jgi:ribonuclease HI
MADLKEVIIYTDGASQGNPGPGGYGVVLLHGNLRKELFGGYRRTTNKRMELMAVIAGLQALKTKCKVTIYSDCDFDQIALYLHASFNRFFHSWPCS